MKLTRAAVICETTHHASMMAIAREKYPGKPICPDCYMPTGMHRNPPGTWCEIQLVDARPPRAAN